MNLSRREFTGHLLKGATVIAIAGEGVLLEGCNLYNDILNWVPVGEASLNSILSILSANGIAITPAAQLLVTTIEAGFTALTAAVKEYQSTTPPPVGAVAKIQTVFKDITDNFGTFLKSLNVSGSLVAVVVGIAQVVLSTIAAFANKLPVTPTAATARTLAPATVKVAATVQAVVPKERKLGNYKRDFNSELSKGEKQGVAIPKNAYLSLTLAEHMHMA